MESPRLLVLINVWTFANQRNPAGEKWSIDQKLDAVVENQFDALSTNAANAEGLKEKIEARGLRFGGAFDAGAPEEFADKIAAQMAVDNGPINCQLGDHDTPIEQAIEWTIALMEEADRQNAPVHLEVHRDTCTETPEKTFAIVEGVKKATGRYPRVNFDFSHPAIVKHLNPKNFAERLFENIPLFQQSTLWHMRPFNGHHCQIPITDGHGHFSPEYEAIRPFIRTAFDHWLAGPRPTNTFWVMPELGPKPGYGISCFPDSWQDAIVLGHDLENLWKEAVANLTA